MANFDVVTGGVRSADVGGEVVNLQVVFLCVLLQHCEVEFTFVPHLVERVFQQVVLVENAVELFEKLLFGHNCRSPLRIVQPLKCYSNLAFCKVQVFNC